MKLTDEQRKRAAKAIVETYLGFPAPDREPCDLDFKAADAAFAAASAPVIADTAGAKPLSDAQKQSLEAKVMEGFDVSKLKHEDGCRWWQDETFCTCGADQAELCRRWKSHALYWKDVANEYERVWMEESRRLLIANGCCERLMNACTDAGCPDGVRMDDWIRDNCRASPAIDAVPDNSQESK